MLKRLDKVEKKGLDYKANILAGKTGIQAKLAGETIGVLQKGSFANYKEPKNFSKEDKLLLIKNMKRLQNHYAGLGYCEGGNYGGQLTLADVQRRMAEISEDNKKRYRWDPVSKTMYKA